ncbi:MAG TPA: ATP-binding protein [Actinoallomurus sp.]|nr:ATP-binding protein [Actinoallomurus sp.]
MAFLGALAVMELLVAGSSSPKARLTLVVIAAAAVVVIGAAVFGADTATRRERRIFGHPAGNPEDLQRRLGELGFLVSRGRQEVQGLADRIAAGETPPPNAADSRPAATSDLFVRLGHEIQKAQNEAWNAIINAASANTGGGTGSAQRVEIFVNLARRMQSLSHRAIKGLDELENQVEDPDLLKGLFRVDHLSTRMRRQAESLAVIGGAASRRQWSRPVTMYEVLRSAIAEVEHYNRVKVVPPVEGTLDGGAVADVIHLLAELIENATKFAPPHTQVLLRAEPVTAGLAIEIEDRGLGIPRENQRRLNDLLADLERVDVDELLHDGRIGLLVVSALSRRHSVAVRLQTNLYGGTQATIVIPKELIGSEEELEAQQAKPQPEPVAALSTGTSALPSAAELSPSMPLSGSGQGAVTMAPVLSDHEATASRLGETSSPAWDDRTSSHTWEDQNDSPQTQQQPDPAPAGNADRRPDLPRRNAQANLSPELLTTPAPPADEPEPDHNPGLMAAFKKGMRSGQEDGPGDEAGNTA